MLPGQNLIGQVDLLVHHLHAGRHGRVLQLGGDGLQVGVELAGRRIFLRRLGDVHVKLVAGRDSAAAEGVETDGEGDVGQKLRVSVLENGNF